MTDLRFVRTAAEAAMWHAMFVGQISVTEKILRTVIVYALIAVLFRLTGKRGLASMNTFDFVVIFLLSNVVQNAVIGNDSSLIGGIVGARAGNGTAPGRAPPAGPRLPVAEEGCEAGGNL